MTDRLVGLWAAEVWFCVWAFIATVLLRVLAQLVLLLVEMLPQQLPLVISMLLLPLVLVLLPHLSSHRDDLDSALPLVGDCSFPLLLMLLRIFRQPSTTIERLLKKMMTMIAHRHLWSPSLTMCHLGLGIHFSVTTSLGIATKKI
jgi:hypothetical protein